MTPCTAKWHVDAWTNSWRTRAVNHLAFNTMIHGQMIPWARLHWLNLKYRKGVKSWKNARQRERCSISTATDVWKQKDCENGRKKKKTQNVVLCAPRQRSPVAWVNEVISRDGVSCHTLGNGLRIQSPSHVSIMGPPRQLTNRSNTVYDEPGKSATAVLHANLHTGVQIENKVSPQHSLILLWHLVSNLMYKLMTANHSAREHKTRAQGRIIMTNPCFSWFDAWLVIRY